MSRAAVPRYPCGVPVPVLRSPYAQLCYDWGSAYQIERLPGGGVRAGRRDGGRWITADSVEDMGRLLSADYARRPVPREVAP